GDLDDVVVDVDADHFARAARRRIHRESAGVAAQVQHAPAFAQVREPLAVVALVGEEAGLVRARGVGAELDAVFGDDRGLRRLRGLGRTAGFSTSFWKIQGCEDRQALRRRTVVGAMASIRGILRAAPLLRLHSTPSLVPCTCPPTRSTTTFTPNGCATSAAC